MLARERGKKRVVHTFFLAPSSLIRVSAIKSAEWARSAEMCQRKYAEPCKFPEAKNIFPRFSYIICRRTMNRAGLSEKKHTDRFPLWLNGEEKGEERRAWNLSSVEEREKSNHVFFLIPACRRKEGIIFFLPQKRLLCLEGNRLCFYTYRRRRLFNARSDKEREEFCKKWGVAASVCACVRPFCSPYFIFNLQSWIVFVSPFAGLLACPPISQFHFEQFFPLSLYRVLESVHSTRE